MISRFYFCLELLFACLGFIFKFYQSMLESIFEQGLLLIFKRVKAAAETTRGNNNNDNSSTEQQRFDEEVLHEQLLAIERNNDYPLAEDDNNKLRVAVGFGSCKDQFIRAVDFFNVFGIDHDNAKLTHRNHIDSRNQLEEMFLFYFSKGVAAERFVSNKSLFHEIATTVNKNKLPIKEALGGNAPVMAGRFAKDACHVYLGSIIGNNLNQIANVHPRITVLNEESESDDTHILMEYDVKDSVGVYRAPRANRFIVHSDDSNPYISVLERFFEGIVKFRPHLVVVGGLQMLDNFPFKDGEMGERLRLLGAQLKGPHLAKSLVHFELASFIDPELMRHLIEQVVNASDSLGMNEQELANLYSYLASGQVTLAEDAYVGLEVELNKIRFVFQNLETRPRSRVLTRVHLHTILFQVVAIRRPPQRPLMMKSDVNDGKTTTPTASDEVSPWQNGHLAVARSSLMATRHACQSHALDLTKVKLLFRGPVTLPCGEQRYFSAQTPVISWSETLRTTTTSSSSPIILDFYVTPVLICTDVKQTTGGGDNISPVGLVSQLNHHTFLANFDNKVH